VGDGKSRKSITGHACPIMILHGDRGEARSPIRGNMNKVGEAVRDMHVREAVRAVRDVQRGTCMYHLGGYITGGRK